MSDIDLELDKLFNEVEESLKRRKKPLSIEKDEILWGYYSSIYECLNCGRLFHGKLFHPNINIPNRRYVAGCPECLDKELWWRHQNFTVEKIEMLRGS